MLHPSQRAEKAQGVARGLLGCVHGREVWQALAAYFQARIGARERC